MPEFCTSCFQCFIGEKASCPHSKYVIPIKEKLLSADLIILTSPVYSYHVSGQMKVLLDHFANIWIVHRPEKEMFSKQGIVISTVAGPVFNNTLNEMKDSLDFWGVSRTYKIGSEVFNTDWVNVHHKFKNKLLKRAKDVAYQVQKKSR